MSRSAALRASAGTPSASNPQVLMARGRIEREVGSPDSAVAAFMGYLSHGGDQGLGLYELGRTQLGMGLDVGAVSYYEGAAYNDTLSVPLYRKDLAYFADSTELAGFDAASGPARTAWLKEFWTSRDHASLRSPNERLKEQYRRLAYVRQNFRLASVNRHYQIEEIYHSGSNEFDDRGMIYLRHGTPSDRASYSEPGIEPNETWVYRNPDGDLVFNFVSREDVQDFKLVESLMDIFGYATAVQLAGVNRSLAFNTTTEQLLTSREPISPIYGKMKGAGGASVSRYMTEERNQGRQSYAVGTTTDSYELHFPRDLSAKVQVLAVGRDAQGPMVQVAYAIPGSSLTAIKTSRGEVYHVRLRFVVLDSTGHAVASIDTTRFFLSKTPVPLNEHLVGRAEVHVPPGVHQYRVLIQQGEDAGLILPTDTRADLGGGAALDQRPGARAAGQQPRLDRVARGHGVPEPAPDLPPERGHAVVLRGLWRLARGHAEDRDFREEGRRRQAQVRGAGGGRGRPADAGHFAGTAQGRHLHPRGEGHSAGRVFRPEDAAVYCGGSVGCHPGEALIPPSRIQPRSVIPA